MAAATSPWVGSVVNKRDAAALVVVAVMVMAFLDLKSTMATTQQSVQSIKQEVQSIKQEVQSMKQDVQSVKQEVQSLKWSHRSAAELLDGCTVPVIAYCLNGSNVSQFRLSLSFVLVDNKEWFVTAAHNLGVLSCAFEVRIGNAPFYAMNKHRVSTPVPRDADFLRPQDWAVDEGCDVAVHPVSNRTLVSRYQPCLADDGEEVRHSDTAVLWAANQPNKFSSGQVTGYTEEGNCVGAMTFDARVRKGFSGSGVAVERRWVGLVTSEVDELSVYMRSGDDGPLGNRLYGMAVMTSALRHLTAQMRNVPSRQQFQD